MDGWLIRSPSLTTSSTVTETQYSEGRDRSIDRSSGASQVIRFKNPMPMSDRTRTFSHNILRTCPSDHLVGSYTNYDRSAREGGGEEEDRDRGEREAEAGRCLRKLVEMPKIYTRHDN